MHIEINIVCQISIFMGQPRWGRLLRRGDELESDDRSASSLANSNPGGAAFANCILGVALAKLRMR